MDRKVGGAELAAALPARQKDAVLYCGAHLGGEDHLQKQVQEVALGLGMQTGCGQFQACFCLCLGWFCLAFYFVFFVTENEAAKSN